MRNLNFNLWPVGAKLLPILKQENIMNWLVFLEDQFCTWIDWTLEKLGILTKSLLVMVHV